MPRRPGALTGASALALTLSLSPAVADVTPAEVWESFRTYLETSGYAVTAGRRDEGDALIVEGLVARMPMPEESGELVFEGGDVTFADQGDGSVLVTFPEAMPITITTAAPDQPETVVSLSYNQSGLALLAYGDATETIYDINAESVGISLEGITVEGEALPAEMADGAFTLAGLTGSMSMVRGALMTITQTMQAEQMTYGFRFTDPDTGETGNVSGAMREVVLEGGGDMPEIDPGMTADEMIAAGLDVSARFRYADGSTQFTGTSEGQEVSGESSSSGGAFEFAMSEAGLLYDISADNLAMSASVPDLPFPVSAEMQRMQVAFNVPVTASEEPQPMAMILQLTGLEVAEIIWSMFDPANILPRDPATLMVDLSGEVTPFVSILDPEAMADVDADKAAPGELNALTINALELSAAGARLTGQGAFTFDNSDLQTFDGMPAPEGAATLNLTGANALIDKLIQMGIVTNEDAMGARMMISMFSVPGEGEDSLTSTVTVTGEGQILANGQRIR